MKTSILIAVILMVLFGIAIIPEAKASDRVGMRGVVIGGTELKVTGAIYDCATDRLTAVVAPMHTDDNVTYAISCTTKKYTYLNEKGESIEGLQPLDKAHLDVFDLLCFTIRKSQHMCDPNNDEPALNYGW